MTVYERRKADLPDFYGILNGAEQFTDASFPPEESSLYWTEFGEYHDSWAGATWARASTLPGTLFGDGISADDINQGAISNCWFMGAASAIAEQ